jgi:Putative cyclase
VLIDLAAGGGYDPFSHVAFCVADLEAALLGQGSSLRFGDIVCVRTGWIEKYLTLESAARRELAARLVDPFGYTCAGLAGSEDISRFLWNSGAAAVTCDNPRSRRCRSTRGRLAASAAHPVPGLRDRRAV